MRIIDTLRSVLHFRRIELDAATRRLARAASVADLRRIAQAAVAARRVRLHRRRGRGRAHAAQQLATRSRRIEFRPRVLRVVGGDRPVDDAARAAAAVPAGAGADRVHPHRRPAGRAGRGPGRRAGRPAVHAVDAGHPLDRGGRRGQRRAASGSRSTCGATAGSSRRWSTGAAACGLRGARADRRHGRARAARARRAARASSCRRRSGWARCSTVPCTPAGRGRSPGPSRSGSPTSPGAATCRATAPTR